MLTLGVAWHHPVGVVTTTIGMHINTMYHDTEVTGVVRLSESVTCHNNARAKYTCKKLRTACYLKCYSYGDVYIHWYYHHGPISGCLSTHVFLYHFVCRTSSGSSTTYPTHMLCSSVCHTCLLCPAIIAHFPYITAHPECLGTLYIRSNGYRCCRSPNTFHEAVY